MSNNPAPTVAEQIEAIEQQIVYCRTVISLAIRGRLTIAFIDMYERRVECLEAAAASLRAQAQSRAA
jgi:hypothetical protein